MGELAQIEEARGRRTVREARARRRNPVDRLYGEFLTKQELSATIRVSTSTLDRRVAQGRLRVHVIDGRRRFRLEEALADLG